MKRQPGFDAAEPRIRAGIPSHRGAGMVAAGIDSGLAKLGRVADAVWRHFDVLYARFVTKIPCRCAAQRQQKHRCNARLCLADTGRDPRPIMVAEHPIRPAIRWQGRLVTPYPASNFRRIPLRRDQLEIEGQVDARCLRMP